MPTTDDVEKPGESTAKILDGRASIPSPHLGELRAPAYAGSTSESSIANAARS